MSVKLNMLPMGYILHIRSFRMPDNTTASHKNTVTIYYKSRGIRVLPETKYVTDGIICTYLFLQYGGQYKRVTQKPRDHLYMKSWQPWLASFGPKKSRNLKN